MRLRSYRIYSLWLGLIGVCFFVLPLQAGVNQQSAAQSVAPTVTRLEPDDGFVPGGETVQIIGENFQEGATVTLGGNAASNVIFVSPTELMVNVPAGSAGSADVIVTNPDDKSDTLTGGFTYIFSPHDVTQDGVVNILDLVRIANQLGESGEGLSGDVNEDNTVNILDLVAVANHFSGE